MYGYGCVTPRFKCEFLMHASRLRRMGERERRHPCRCGSTLLTMKNTEQGTLWYAAHRCLYQGLNQIYVAPGAEGVYLNPGWDTSIFFSLRPSARPCVELHAGCSTRTDTFATTWTRPPPLGPRNFFLLSLSLSFSSFFSSSFRRCNIVACA